MVITDCGLLCDMRLPLLTPAGAHHTLRFLLESFPENCPSPGLVSELLEDVEYLLLNSSTDDLSDV